MKERRRKEERARAVKALAPNTRCLYLLLVVFFFVALFLVAFFLVAFFLVAFFLVVFFLAAVFLLAGFFFLTALLAFATLYPPSEGKAPKGTNPRAPVARPLTYTKYSAFQKLVNYFLCFFSFFCRKLLISIRKHLKKNQTKSSL